jgi:hypothetical protein
MLFIEGDVRFLVGRNEDGWLVYDTYIDVSHKGNGYYGYAIATKGLETEQDAKEAARNYENEYHRIRSDKNSSFLDSYVFY